MSLLELSRHAIQIKCSSSGALFVKITHADSSQNPLAFAQGTFIIWADLTFFFFL